MCGIITIFKNNQQAISKPLESLLYDMLWIDSVRGNHSTGLIYETEDGPEFFKKAIPGWDFVQLEVVRAIIAQQHKSRFIIGHNRAATRGDVKTSNAHPFQNGPVLGVHNGTVQAYAGLSPNAFTHPVDSAHIYAAIAEDGPGIVIPKIQGSFNLIWHNDETGTVHMSKNDTRPYCFAKLRDSDVLIGASEKPMLKWLVARHNLEIEYCWTPEDYVEYVWDVAEDMVSPFEAIQHTRYTAPPKLKAEAYVPPPNGLKSPIGGEGKRIISATTIEMLEFFFEDLKANLHLSNGVRTCTGYGETLEGDPVVAYNLPFDEYEEQVWYTTRGAWVNAVNTKESYWQVFNKSIKPHPVDNPDEMLMICSCCGQDHPESKGVFVGHAPLCLDCCKLQHIQPYEVEDGDQYKLIMQ